MSARMRRRQQVMWTAATVVVMARWQEEGWAVPQDYRGPDGGPLTVHDNSVEPISDWAW